MPAENSRSQEKHLVFWSWEARVPWSHVSLRGSLLAGAIMRVNRAVQATEAMPGTAYHYGRGDSDALGCRTVVPKNKS